MQQNSRSWMLKTCNESASHHRTSLLAQIVSGYSGLPNDLKEERGPEFRVLTVIVIFAFPFLEAKMREQQARFTWKEWYGDCALIVRSTAKDARPRTSEYLRAVGIKSVRDWHRQSYQSDCLPSLSLLVRLVLRPRPL